MGAPVPERLRRCVPASAAETAQGVGRADMLPDGAESVEGRLRAVCAILDGMQRADGLCRVRAVIERRRRA